MSENLTNKYLDFDGLRNYDDLIKKHIAKYISSRNEELFDAIETLDNKVDEKQDIIPDLEDIRSGAAAGATALQEDNLGFATDGDIDDIFK